MIVGPAMHGVATFELLHRSPALGATAAMHRLPSLVLLEIRMPGAALLCVSELGTAFEVRLLVKR